MRRSFVPFLLLFSCTSYFVSPALMAGDPPPDEALSTSQSSEVPAGATAVSGDAKGRLISGAGVRLRERPSTSGKELARLSLGTEVIELERSAKDETIGGTSAPWLRIKTSEGKEGWIFGSFCRPFDAATREEAIRSLITARLANENLPEGDARELFTFAGKLEGGASTPLQKAEYGMARLRALQALLDAIAQRSTNRLDENGLRKDSLLAPVVKDLVYNEPAGSWLVLADRFWAHHETHRTTPLADELAWAACQQRLPGETEGYVPAIIHLVWMTEGRYLKLYPKGKHAAEAVQSTIESFKNFDSSWDPTSEEKNELQELRTKVADLKEAVTATEPGAHRDTLLQAIETFSKRLP